MEDLLIAGAGPAGLAAGRAAQRAGMRSRILEATERPGGRIRTEGDLEHGARFVHDKRLRAFVESMGLTVTPFDEEAGAYVFETSRPGPERDGDGKHSMTALLQEMRLSIRQLPRRESMSIEQFLKENLLRINPSLAKRISIVRGVFENVLEAELGASLDHVSIRSALEANTFDGTNYLVREGYSSVPQRMAEGLHIDYASPVERVSWGGPEVVFHTPDGAHTAHTGILAVPLGILQEERIAFDPPLPPRVQQAIGRLGNAKICELIYRLERPCWPEDMTVLRTDIPDAPVIWPNGTNPPSLTCYLGGRASHRAQRMSEQEAVRQGVEHLATIFGDRVRSLILSGKRMGWNIEQWTRTGYSYMRSGNDEARSVLAQPVEGRIGFVGEAFVDDPTASTVSAAIFGAEAMVALLRAG